MRHRLGQSGDRLMEIEPAADAPTASSAAESGIRRIRTTSVGCDSASRSATLLEHSGAAPRRDSGNQARIGSRAEARSSRSTSAPAPRPASAGDSSSDWISWLRSPARSAARRRPPAGLACAGSSPCALAASTRHSRRMVAAARKSRAFRKLGKSCSRIPRTPPGSRLRPAARRGRRATASAEPRTSRRYSSSISAAIVLISLSSRK